MKGGSEQSRVQALCLPFLLLCGVHIYSSACTVKEDKEEEEA